MEYDFIKPNSLLLKVLKNEEFMPIEEILKESKRLRLLQENKFKILSHSDEDNYDTDSRESDYSSYDENEKQELNLISKPLQNNNNSKNPDLASNKVFQKRKTKFMLIKDELENDLKEAFFINDGNNIKNNSVNNFNPSEGLDDPNNISSLDKPELLAKYLELEKKYNALVDTAGKKLEIMENRRKTLLHKTDQIFEDLKQEAVNNLNEVIETKSKEISQLNEKVEDLKIQIIKKENEINKKLLEAHKENNELKFKYKKQEIENSSLNDFILTYQSDIMLLQNKIEKKSICYISIYYLLLMRYFIILYFYFFY